MDLLTGGDVPFVVGIFIGPLIGAAVFTTAVATRRSAALVVSVSVLTAVMIIAFVTYWWAWGAGFDQVDAGQELSRGLDVAMDTAIGVSFGTTLLLLVVGTVAAATLMTRRDPDPVLR
ncbi:MAG: hypothetical protein ABWX74_00325 [Aeromicrobium sp.]